METLTLNTNQAHAVAQYVAALSRSPTYRRHGAQVAIGFCTEGPCGPGLYLWPADREHHKSPLFAKALPHERDFAHERLPARDTYGMVFHPDMEGIGDDEYPLGPQFRAIGWETQTLCLDDDDTIDKDRKDAHFDKGEGDFSFWTPHVPLGHLLAAMYDTEDGPVALFVRKAESV